MAAALLLSAPPARALKVATYNLMGYENPGEGPGLPSPYITSRQANFRTILAALDPDVILTQETNSQAAADSFRLDVLDLVEPGQWAGTWLYVNSGEGMGLFYKPAKVSIANFTGLSTGGPRLAIVAIIKPVGYVKNTAWFRTYGIHFKAGSTTTDATTRNTEATNLRSAINNAPLATVGPSFLVMGDSNIYDGTEGAYLRLTESQTNDNGRSFDYLALASPWHQNGLNSAAYTQCPCNSCSTTGQSGGGLDDRFDLALTSASLIDGAGLEYVPGSYTPFGNDGQHFNTDINAYGFNNAVGLTVANALHDAADHIPVMVTLRLPAKLATASQLSFGTAIMGAGVTQTLSVANVASTPAADLVYTLTGSGGFVAPVDTFTLAAGAAANLHALAMDTSAPAALNGAVTLASNDNDTTSKAVLLDGRVLAHAAPSLDSVATVASGLLYMGSQFVGGFTDKPLRVFDAGYGPLRARLSLTGATLTGDPRFSLAGGFGPVTFGSPGVTYTVHFDDTAAPPDSDYSALLTFSTADEPLPGATPLAPVTVELRAHVLSGNAGVGGTPAALRFDPPSPNPAHDGATMAFDLPRGAHVALGVYDLGGRRVARLADGELGQGHHVVRWNAQDDAGRPVPAGLYFVRFQTPGLTRIARVAILP